MGVIGVTMGLDIARAGTSPGTQKRAEFLSDLLSLLGDVRLLYLPKLGDTTTSTDESKNGATITWDATVASRLGYRGSGVSQLFDGVNDEGDIPDNARYSFGNGTLDEPFTIAALVYVDDATPASANTIISRWNKDTDGELREWRAFLTGTNGYPTLELYDESANAYIGRQDQTALTASTWTLLVFTYDGTRVNGGIKVYKNVSQVDDANSSSGTYIAMEDLAVVVSLAHTLSAAASPVAEEFWAGRIGLISVSGGALSSEEVKRLTVLVNSFCELSLS